MLNFEPFSLEALKKVLPYIKKTKSLCSDLSSGALFMWHSPDTRFCIYNDTFAVHQTVGGGKAFSWPVGADVDGMIVRLLEYAEKNSLPLRFYVIDEETLDIIKSDYRLKNAAFAYDEKWSDYIYSFSEALTFSGKKFSGQRNHINKFKSLYGEPSVNLLSKRDNAQLHSFMEEYKKEHTFKNKLERLEFSHTERLIDVYSELGLIAASIKINGKIAAFSIGEVIGDMLIIHVEKALTKYRGIYPTMYQSFVNLVKDTLGRELNIVNREDDSGDLGLRTSKMQYKPIGRVHKYMVHVNSPVICLSEIPIIKKDSIVITPFYERDKKAYLKMNTDIDNNRFWGYDYREDFSITSEITEDTFFDGALHDMKTGDSINFAIRLKEDGEMIGEGILWNFTYNQTAELGCRILPEHHGKGYGKETFGAIADFGEKALGLKIWARCHKENTGSYKMITGSGFRKTKEDDTFYYFEK